jgi:predicted RNA-binding Zn ribbon-like protein
MQTEARESPFLFVGNLLWLDFINTEIITNGQRVDLIHSYADLKAWLLEAQAVDATAMELLEAAWSEEEKARITVEARELRAILRSMAEQISTGQAVSHQVIEALNGWLAQRKGYHMLSRTEDGYELTTCYEEGAGGCLAPIAESAAGGLAYADLKLVRKCEDPQCILYFYDTSKSHTRRWCSMDLCGNRSKVAAHYQRSRRTTTDNADASSHDKA